MNSATLGLGTWGMGGNYERDERTAEAALAVLDLGLALGLTFIDTAELYGGGLSEELVGRAIKKYPRESVFITTKVWRTHMHYDDVLRAADGSLKRLDTGHIDLYLIHWPSETVPIEETLRAMLRLREEGIVRAVGVSNFSVTQMEETERLLGRGVLAANQIEFNVRNQAAAAQVLPFCKERGMRVIAYRPLAQGHLGGASTSILAELAQSYGKTVNQIALNWLLAQGITAIPATMNLDHLRENAGARDFMLAPEDIQRLCSN